MSKTGGVRTFRAPRSIVAVVAFCALLLLAVALVSFKSQGLSSGTTVLFCLIPVGVAGALDAVISRVELHEEHLVVVRNLRKREYARSSFQKAQWGKGVPVTLQLKSGGWVTLPGVGPSSQGLVNSLRAWLVP